MQMLPSFSSVVLDNPVDQVYYDLYRYTLETGTRKENRTGTATIATFGASYRLDVKASRFPILTIKKIPWTNLVTELIWYISGKPHIRQLRKTTKIWDAWASDKGELETAYGRYWRYYPMPGERPTANRFVRAGREVGLYGNGETIIDDARYIHNYRVDEALPGIAPQYIRTFDQLAFVVDELKANPNSRRLHLTAWYPPNAATSLLPPCHHSWTLNVDGEGKLNLHLQQRSGDLGLGIPWNLSCYCLILLLLCQETGRQPGSFFHTITDLHLYEDHIEPLAEMFKTGKSYRAPVLDISGVDRSLIHLTERYVDQIKLVNYTHGPHVKLPVAV